MCGREEVVDKSAVFQKPGIVMNRHLIQKKRGVAGKTAHEYTPHFFELPDAEIESPPLAEKYRTGTEYQKGGAKEIEKPAACGIIHSGG